MEYDYSTDYFSRLTGMAGIGELGKANKAKKKKVAAKEYARVRARVIALKKQVAQAKLAAATVAGDGTQAAQSQQDLLSLLALQAAAQQQAQQQAPQLPIAYSSPQMQNQYGYGVDYSSQQMAPYNPTYASPYSPPAPLPVSYQQAPYQYAVQPQPTPQYPQPAPYPQGYASDYALEEMVEMPSYSPAPGQVVGPDGAFAEGPDEQMILSDEQMMMLEGLGQEKKPFLTSGAGLLVLAAIGVGAWWWMKGRK